MIKTGGHSDILPLRSVLLKHPKDAFLDQDTLEENWEAYNYSSCPDFNRSLSEYESFIRLLRNCVTDIRFLPPSAQSGIDSIYVRDAAVATDKGLVLGKMGKELRRFEPEALGSYAENNGIPVLGRICGEGRLEGGDVFWMDESTIVVGEGPRTNAEGIRQLKTLLQDLEVDVITVPLPEWDDPRDVFHLMSFFSPIDRKKAVVYPKLVPPVFQDLLEKKEYVLIEVPESEYDTLACNVLSLESGKCVIQTGNPVTIKNLKKQGITVWEYEGGEISQKGGGGPTCLTCPILRTE